MPAVLGEDISVVVGITSMVVEASVSVDGTVVEAAFVAVEGAVVLGEDVSVVVGVTSMVAEASVSVDGAVCCFCC